MLTYGDMVTLLLCLFVLLFAYSTVNQPKFILLRQSLTSAFNGPKMFAQDGQVRGALGGSAQNASDSDILKAGSIPNLVKRVRRAFQAFPRKNVFELDNKPNHVNVRINANALFPKGGAELAGENEDVLLALLPLFRDLPAKMVRFVGHTDNDPVRSKGFPSNWELSSARAAAVARFFMDDFRLPPERVSVESRGAFEPLCPNDSEENKTRNRRVEVIFVVENDPLEARPLLK